MNDFTKDELDICREGISWLIESHSKEYGEKEVALWFPLMNKIKSLIANYCEHESKINIGEAPMICQKCGKVTG